MACVDNIECLGEYCSCGDSIELNLVSEYTGEYEFRAEFNGVVLRNVIEVTEGDKIIVPNIFNENYTHIISFYNENGDLVNDLKYSVKIVICKGEGLTPISDSEYDLSEYESTDYN
jgi:hypothetical protein